MKTLQNRNKNALGYSVFAIVCISICLGSCCAIKVTKPVEVKDPTSLIIPDTSYLGIKVCISNSDFLLAVKDNIKNPIVKDDPIKVIAAITATEDITFESLVNVLVTPFKPGYWQNVAVKTYQTIRESFSCLLSPWKWGSCWRDVVKEVWVTTQKWVEPQLAVYKWTTVLATKIVDRIFEPEVTVHYPTYLDDIKISFSGNKYTITGYTITKVKIDYESKLIPLTPTIHINSILSSDIKCEIVIKGEVNITNTKEIAFKPTVNSFNVVTPIDKLPKLAGTDFYQYLFTDLAVAKLTEKIVEEVGKQSLQKAMERMLENNKEKLNFSEKIDIVTQAMSGPKELSKDIWLNLKPTAITSSNPIGSNDDLCINIGLGFVPSVSYSEKPIGVKPSSVAFKVEDPHSPGTNINLRLSGSLKKLERIISDSLNNKLTSSDNIILNGLIVKNVSIYRTDNKKIVVALDVFGKKIFKKCKIFSAYLVGTLLYNDSIKQFSFVDLDFDVNTRTKLLNSIYKDFIDPKIEDLIEKHSIFNVEPIYREANKLLDSLYYETDYGILSGNLPLINLLGPYITDSTIDVIAQLKGDLNFKLIYKKPEMFASNYLSGKSYESLSFRNKTKNKNIMYNRNKSKTINQIGEITSDTTYERQTIFNKNLRQDFSKMNRIDLDTSIITISKNLYAPLNNKLDIPNLVNSDTVVHIIDIDVNKITKRKSFEDNILKGEEYIFIDSAGKIRRKIYE